MKKFLFLITFISCVLYAGDKVNTLSNSKLYNTEDINNEVIRKYLVGLEKFNFAQAVIIKDYFEASSCRKDFYNHSSLNDLNIFVFSSKYDELNSAYEDDKKEYEELIKKEQFINCNVGNK